MLGAQYGALDTPGASARNQASRHPSRQQSENVLNASDPLDPGLLVCIETQKPFVGHTSCSFYRILSISPNIFYFELTSQQTKTLL